MRMRETCDTTFFCDRTEESQMLFHATSEQLGIPPVPLHLHKKITAGHLLTCSLITCFLLLAPYLFLLHTCSFSPPRNAESRCCTGTAVPRRERSFLRTRLHAVRTRNTFPFSRAYILLSLTHKNSLARTSVSDTCSQEATMNEGDERLN